MKNKKIFRHGITGVLVVAMALNLWAPPVSNAQTLRGQMTESAAPQKQKVRKEHRFGMSSGKLKIDLSPVVIEGYDGREVIISTMVELVEEKNDPRAAGLVNLSSLGSRENNTGLGLNTSVQGEVTTIQRVKPFENDTVYLQIPKQLAVEIANARSFWVGGDITIQNVAGEVEVSQTHGNVMLLNITGPATVKTAHGNIEAVFNEPVKGPISLISNFGFVDAALPSRTKADVEVSTMMGEIFADESLQIVSEEEQDSSSKSAAFYTVDSTGQAVFLSNGRAFDRFGSVLSLSGRVNFRIKGKLNGGGDQIILKTTQGKIYLRRAD